MAPTCRARRRSGRWSRRLLALVPELPRLRLSSLDPAAIDDDLWRLIAEEPRLMPHLHLSLQAGSDLILKRMKRRHLRADALAVVARARATCGPGIAIGADLIAGFPTETEALFERNAATSSRRRDLPFLHVFPYSERPGTPAARMPAVPQAAARASARRGCARPGRRSRRRFFAARSGGPCRVLTETRRGRPHRAFRAGAARAPAVPRAADARRAVTGATATRLLAEAA